MVTGEKNVATNCGTYGLYRPLSTRTICLAFDSRALRRSAVLRCKIPFTTALSMTWKASLINTCTGARSASLAGGLALNPSRATNTFFILVVISDFLDLLYMRFRSAVFSLLSEFCLAWMVILEDAAVTDGRGAAAVCA